MSDLVSLSNAIADTIKVTDPDYTLLDWDNFKGSDWIASRQNCHQFGEITVITHKDKPTLKLFIAQELAKVFDYKRTEYLTKILESGNFRVAAQANLKEINGLQQIFENQGREINPQGMKLVNYAGFNHAITHSTMDPAKVIRAWVYGSIEKVGNQLKTIANNLEKIDYLPNNQYITVENGIPYTTSKIISQFFDIRHDNLLRLIDNKINNLLNLDNDDIVELFNSISLEPTSKFRPDQIDNTNDKLVEDVNYNIKSFINDNFIKSEYITKDNRIAKQYRLTEQGFSFIVMGLTGVKADIYKIAFVKSFYEMRKIIQDRLKSTYLRKAFPNKTNEDQFVYIIKNPFTNFIKIGISKHVEKRVKELETGAGCPLELVYKSMLCTNSFEIETILHKRYKHLNKFKEWFEITNIQEVIDYIENNVKVELTSNFDELKELCNKTSIISYI